MASFPVIAATAQSCVLAATSNLLAQAITLFRDEVRPRLALMSCQWCSTEVFGDDSKPLWISLVEVLRFPQSPLVVDWVPLFQFVLFALLNTPPNFLW